MVNSEVFKNILLMFTTGKSNNNILNIIFIIVNDDASNIPDLQSSDFSHCDFSEG
jgi:hypothetical protein